MSIATKVLPTIILKSTIDNLSNESISMFTTSIPFKLLFLLLNNLDKDKYIIQTHTRPTFCKKRLVHLNTT